MEENTIWNRDALDWFCLMVSIINIIFVMLDIYTNNVSIFTLFCSFAAGLLFSDWLTAGLFRRSQRIARRCLNQTAEILEKYTEASKLVERQNILISELQNERRIKNRCSQRKQRRKRSM